jgi:hypothetical protein
MYTGRTRGTVRNWIFNADPHMAWRTAHTEQLFIGENSQKMLIFGLRYVLGGVALAGGFMASQQLWSPLRLDGTEPCGVHRFVSGGTR